MTFQQIQESTSDFLIPTDVAEVLGCKAYNINLQAHQDPSKLGFPVSVIGTRVKISRLGFIHWMLYGNSPVVLADSEK